jgi:hypothetical protein
MKFHSDASLVDRFTRTPYGPPDYVSAFYYLTDTHPQSPSFCVVPKTMKSRSLEEARELLGDDYAETPIYGKAGTCTIVDTAIMHTRLDGDGRAGRRIMHHAYARGGWILNDQGASFCSMILIRFSVCNLINLNFVSFFCFTTGWRGPSPVNNPSNLFPQRLVQHSDPEVRRFFSLWAPSMCEWVATGFDPEYRSHRPTKGSPDPAQARR